MSRTTPIYRLPYLEKGDVLTGLIERTRFQAIDRQLEALFTFLGDGIISGWTIEPDSTNSVILKKGSGVISSIAAATTGDISITGIRSGVKNYIYAKLLDSTAYTAQAQFFSSTIQLPSKIYLCLGTVTPNDQGVIIESSISDEGRTSLSLISQVINIISQHVHTGSPGEPEKIDLFNHVKGVLSATNIEDIPASKISSGTIDRERFAIEHSDLLDKGTLSHAELDSLVEKLQDVNKILFGDIMTSNLSQLFLSMKHVWEDIDEYMVNFMAVIPGISNNTINSENTFIDINATTAEIDYENHKIQGRYVPSKELGQISIKTRFDFESGEYDTNYIQIVDKSMAYGYGYGYGDGLDYFDVIQTGEDLFLNGETALTGFVGSEIGYGVSDITGEYDFESYFSGQYAYGYGWEYATGFPYILDSTYVTLKSDVANLIIHNKSTNNNIFEDENTYYTNSSNYYDPKISDTGAEVIDLLIQSSNNADVNGIRSSTLNTEVDSQSANLLSFLSVKEIYGDETGGYENSDVSLAYINWEIPYDMSTDRYIYFVLKQENNNGSTKYAQDFDNTWNFDHSMNLIVESTIDDSRYFYRYKGETGSSSYRFFDRNIEYFNTSSVNLPVDDLVQATVVVSAQIVDDTQSDGNLEFLGGYTIDSNKIDESNPPSLISIAPSFSIARKNITGIYLSAKNDDIDFYNRDQDYGHINFPQGKRKDINQSVYETVWDQDTIDSKMPVDIDSIYISGEIGFSNNIDRNKIDELTISFPDSVDFTSISWISSEPYDSVVYIQIKKDDPTSSIDSDYRTIPIYTNKGEELNTRAENISSISYVDPESMTEEEFNTTINSYYKPSGSDFSSDFLSTKRIKIRVVLLPTLDGKTAPVLNSITINYKSQTLSGSSITTTADQWTNARKQVNLEVSSSGEVNILDFNRTKNVIYGTNGKIIEYKGNDSSWTEKVKTYTGDNLPLTVQQKLYGVTSRISGFVTDVKVLKTGNIMFLDRESSRIVEVDKDYQLKRIFSSEYAYNSNIEDISYSDKATMIKAIYNRELGDNGVLYLVFSHELKAWSDGVNIESGQNLNVDPAKFVIRQAGFATTLEGCEVVACDRGILCFVLTPELSNLIESLPNPKIDTYFVTSSQSEPYVSSPEYSSVVFYSGGENETIVDEDNRIEVAIEKIGTSGIYSDYNLIYMPIQGVVAFDYDEDNGYLYVLKKTRPYTWDGEGFDPERWYYKIKTDTYYTNDGVLEDNLNFDSDEGLAGWEPTFDLGSVYGSKGSIEARNGKILLITFSGLKEEGVKVFRKKSLITGEKYYYVATTISLPSDGVYPMSARFDPKEYSDGETPSYGAIYIATNSLQRSTSGSGAMSKVLRIIDDGSSVDWKWGDNTSDIGSLISTIGYASSINDVRPLLYSDKNGAIVST